jgi:hypothetical protein
MAIYKLEDEIRILGLECREVERSIEVTRRLLPRIPVLDENVALLQKELLEAKRESESLSLQLEDPENKGRWRRLEGKIPTSEELQAKLSQLEERLNDKKEQLLEKELILEEITSLSDRLRGQAAEGRADTLELAKKVNDYQSRIRAVTRKLMATISELSMYQATGIKLAAERDELGEDVEEARERLEAGEAPTAVSCPLYPFLTPISLSFHILTLYAHLLPPFLFYFFTVFQELPGLLLSSPPDRLLNGIDKGVVVRMGRGSVRRGGLTADRGVTGCGVPCRMRSESGSVGSGSMSRCSSCGRRPRRRRRCTRRGWTRWPQPQRLDPTLTSRRTSASPSPTAPTRPSSRRSPAPRCATSESRSQRKLSFRPLSHCNYHSMSTVNHILYQLRKPASLYAFRT